MQLSAIKADVTGIETAALVVNLYHGVQKPGGATGAVDALWYLRGKLAFLFEVEWTAMIGDAVLRRGRDIPVGDQQSRFLVIPAERTELVRLKLARSPWLRGEMERQNWHILKWQHLDTLAARPGARMEWLEPVLGLDPLIEASKKGISTGVVKAKLSIEADGKVSDVEIVEAEPKRVFDRAVKAALMEWKFEPGEKTSHEVKLVFKNED